MAEADAQVLDKKNRPSRNSFPFLECCHSHGRSGLGVMINMEAITARVSDHLLHVPQ